MKVNSRIQGMISRIHGFCVTSRSMMGMDCLQRRRRANTHRGPDAVAFPDRSARGHVSMMSQVAHFVLGFAVLKDVQPTCIDPRRASMSQLSKSMV